MDRQKIIETIQKASLRNRLSCEKAHELSVQLSIPLKEIGDICNELNIKISSCQLGCF